MRSAPSQTAHSRKRRRSGPACRGPQASAFCSRTAPLLNRFNRTHLEAQKVGRSISTPAPHCFNVTKPTTRSNRFATTLITPRQGGSATVIGALPELNQTDPQAAIWVGLISRSGPGLTIGIARGFNASGISRTSSTCRRPLSRLAPSTPT